MSADQATGNAAPCGREGCGDRLICCRPDCPLVAVDIEYGLKRIYTRTEFLAACEMLLRLDAAIAEATNA